MSVTIGVVEALAQDVTEFVTAAGLACQVVPGGEGTIRIAQSEGRQQCSTETLYAGGWIACSDAEEVTDVLGATRADVGKLLDKLDIKLRDCQFGCF